MLVSILRVVDLAVVAVRAEAGHEAGEPVMPRVRYSRRWQLGRWPTIHDIHEHPTWDELVAEARQSWAPQRRNILSIPEWALQDTKKSRNRRAEEFRALARVVGVARASPVGRAQTLVPAPARE